MNNRKIDAHHTLAIRHARKRSASVSAAQTTRTDESPPGVCANDDFSAADAEGGVHMSRPTNYGRKKGPGSTEAFASGSKRRLLQRGVDRVELGIQVAAEAVDDSDNGERNAGRDEAIFDGGSAGLVLHETRNEILHRCDSM